MASKFLKKSPWQLVERRVDPCSHLTWVTVPVLMSLYGCVCKQFSTHPPSDNELQIVFSNF